MEFASSLGAGMLRHLRIKGFVGTTASARLWALADECRQPGHDLLMPASAHRLPKSPHLRGALHHTTAPRSHVKHSAALGHHLASARSLKSSYWATPPAKRACGHDGINDVSAIRRGACSNSASRRSRTPSAAFIASLTPSVRRVRHRRAPGGALVSDLNLRQDAQRMPFVIIACTARPSARR